MRCGWWGLAWWARPTSSSPASSSAALAGSSSASWAPPSSCNVPLSHSHVGTHQYSNYLSRPGFYEQRSVFNSFISLDLQMMVLRQASFPWMKDVGLEQVSLMCLACTNGSEDAAWEVVVVPSFGVPASVLWSLLGLWAARR